MSDSHSKIPCMNPKHDWDLKLATTSTFNRKNINDLISMINSKFDCSTCEFKSWYYHDCLHNNRLFSAIMCHKNRSEICFRICRDSFDIKDNRVRKPNRWFFPEGQERRIDIIEANFDLIMRCLKHAYDCTSTRSMKLPRT